MSRRERLRQQGHALRDAASAAWEKDTVKYGVVGAAATLFALVVAGLAFRKPKAPVDVEAEERERTAGQVVDGLVHAYDRETLLAVVTGLVGHFELKALRLAEESKRNAADAEAYLQAHRQFSSEEHAVGATTDDSTVDSSAQVGEVFVVSAAASPRRQELSPQHGSGAHSPALRSALASPRAQQRVEGIREQVLTTTGPASSPTIFGSDPVAAAARLRKHIGPHVEQQQQVVSSPRSTL